MKFVIVNKYGEGSVLHEHLTEAGQSRYELLSVKPRGHAFDFLVEAADGDEALCELSETLGSGMVDVLEVRTVYERSHTLQKAIDLANDENVTDEAARLVHDWFEEDKPLTLHVTKVVMALLDLCTNG